MKIEEAKEVKIDQQYVDNIKEDLELMVNAVNGAYGMVTFLRITESANFLREALEKQIPKEPIPKPPLGVYCCPSCGKELVGQINNDKRIPIKHCNECGQAVTE